jgi:2-polyprenyl-3-methyl-5-hydroxy-6-metoxy-1,4-benzoquinol methylase
LNEADFQGLNAEVCEIWDANADYWNDRMREGNEFHRVLIAPAQERLLNLQRGDIVLDVGCGNGQFARRMAALGAEVVALDASPRMIENAKANSAELNRGIEYRVIDATESAALIALGERRFDAAVCTMTMMDMASLTPLLSSLQRMLKPVARFVFSVCHPCFNSARVKLVAEEGTSEEGVLRTRYSVNMSEYARPRAMKGVAMTDQPVAQYYFDRPISVLFNACFASGFVLDGLEEPTFPTSNDDGRANWRNFTEIPPVLVARMNAGALRLRKETP